MKREHNILLGTLLGLMLPFSITAAQEEDATDIPSAIKSGKATVSARYRLEFVSDDDVPDLEADPEAEPTEDATASTLRLRLNYRTGHWNGWSAFGEFDHVFHVLIDDFNSGAGTSPNRSEYSTVADPEGSDLNQLYLDYTAVDNWKFRFGRQRILLDNQRFVGGVGWRQNEQTYDAVTLNTAAISNTALSYSYIGEVRRIFGQTVSGGKGNMDGHLLNAKIDVSDSFSVTPYYYLLDYEGGGSNSTATAGVRLAGTLAAGDGKVALLGEFARQSDAADATISYDADYTHLTATWTAENGLSFGLGYESLGTDSSNGQAFRTPLATLHAFNGWADQFLGTPAAGLDDLYFTVKAKAGKWSFTGVYHDFSSETGSFDYGKEFDVSAGIGLGDGYGLLLKAAFFSHDSDSPLEKFDTTKFWLMLTASY
jgi:hypothetical protein